MAFSATLDECGAIRPAATRTRVAGVRPRYGDPVKAGIEHARRDAGLSGKHIERPFLRRFTAEARVQPLSLHPLPCWSILV